MKEKTKDGPTKLSRLAALKTYFDEGYAFTSIIKWTASILGLGNVVINKSITEIWIGAIVYALFCFLVGLWIYKSKYKEYQIEIQNNVNPFVLEMRRIYKGVVPK